MKAQTEVFCTRLRDEIADGMLLDAPCEEIGVVSGISRNGQAPIGAVGADLSSAR